MQPHPAQQMSQVPAPPPPQQQPMPPAPPPQQPIAQIPPPPQQVGQYQPVQHAGPPPHPAQPHGPQPHPAQQHGPPPHPAQQHGPPPHPAQQHGPPPHPGQTHGPPPHPMAQNPYMQYPQAHPHYYPQHPQSMQPPPPMPHGPPHPHPHPQQHMMQHHPGQPMSQGPPQPGYYQPVQHSGPPPPPQQHGHPMQQSHYMPYPQPHPHYYPHHPQQMQPHPTHPSHPAHPSHPPPHPSQQLPQGPPQGPYYQTVQHGPPQPHGPHPMSQGPYMQYPQAHPHYYPHHPQQMHAQPHPHPSHPQSHPHPQQSHMMQQHPSQPMPPHGPPTHHPSYYQPAQGPPHPPPHPPQHPSAQMQPHPPAQMQSHSPAQLQAHPQGPHALPPPPVPQQQSQTPISSQQLPPPASPHHPPSRTHTPQHPPASHTPTRMVPPPPNSNPASPSIVAKVEKKEPLPFPKNSVEATKPLLSKKRRFTSKDVTDIEVWRLLMCLRSGLLAESSWAIDVLSILLNDDTTSSYFGLHHMPGLLEAVLEHFKCCLNLLFKDMGITETTLKPELGKPVCYSHWQEGNGEDTSHIQIFFEPHNFVESSRRCICISTILRNLSFIPGNDVEMSKHAGLLLILGRILSHKPDIESVSNEVDSAPNETHLLASLREDTLVIISNISSSLDLSPYNDNINLSLLKGLLHWACSSSSYALDPFPQPSVTVSPQRLALESLAKLSIIEGNVDLILATPPWTRLEKLLEMLANLLNINEDQTIREFSLVLLSNLTVADSGIARKVALTGCAIPRLVTFLETSLTNQENFATTQDMLRRAASTLKCLSQLVDNHSLFAQYQQRLLNLVMSQKLDQDVVPIIADVIFEISLSY